MQSGSDPQGDMEARELAQGISRALEKLSKTDRSIFVCRYWYTDSISDIAARYNMTYAAVSMELNRLRTKLHNYLIERGYEL